MYFLLHGFLKTGINYDLCIATINEQLELSITDIERTQRIGKPRDAGQKSRPINVEFVRYNDRKSIFNRKKLKAKNIAIAKSLAATLIEMLNKARESTILKMFGHLIGKFHLRMKQKIQLYFMINPDLVSNGQGKKKNALWKKKDGLFFVYF